MRTRITCFFLLLGVFIPTVNSKNQFFDYYYNKYHKSDSTTGTTISTSEFGITGSESHSSRDTSTTAVELPHTSPDDYAEDKITSVQEDYKTETSFETNSTIIQNGDPYDDPGRYVFLARIGIIFGSLLFVILCIGSIACCCPCCCQGKETSGFVVVNIADRQRAEIRPPPVITRPAPVAPVIQHLPPEFSQEPPQFPPQYQHQPLQPQPQYAPVPLGYQHAAVPHPHYSPVQQGYQQQLQFYNPPEAPPPYEDAMPNKF